MPRTPRRLALLLAALAAALLLAACGGEEASWDAQGIRATHERAGFFPQIANPSPGIGPTRLQVALFDPDGEMVHGAEVHARLYYLGDAEDSEAVEPQRVGELALAARSLDLDEQQASRAGASTRLIAGRGEGGGSTHPVHHPAHVTLYVGQVDLDRVGWWGAELDVTVEGQRHENVRVRFWVQERTDEPHIGDAAPPSRQPTVRDVEDIADIDSSRPPNPELHQMTVAEALETGEPFVVGFITPSFCQTRFCGPVMEAVFLPAWREYGDRVHFLHIEPFDIPRAREGQLVPTETTQEWRLRIEPVIYVVGRDGIIAAKFEGILELEELEGALEAVLAE